MSGNYRYSNEPFRKKTKFYNTLWFGAVLGIFAPITIFMAIKNFNYGQLPMEDFLRNAIEYKLMSVFLSQSLIINLGMFFSLLMTNQERGAKGVILATFLYGIAIIYFKFY